MMPKGAMLPQPLPLFEDAIEGRITDRQGAQSQDPQTFAGFVFTFGFPELNGAVWFDPHAIYDSLHGRWLLTMDGFDCTPGIDATFGHGFLFFATSDTSDPTGSWTGSCTA